MVLLPCATDPSRIDVHFPYENAVRETVKGIPQRWWHNDRKTWTIPLIERATLTNAMRAKHPDWVVTVCPTLFSLESSFSCVVRRPICMGCWGYLDNPASWLTCHRLLGQAWDLREALDNRFASPQPETGSREHDRIDCRGQFVSPSPASPQAHNCCGHTCCTALETGPGMLNCVGWPFIGQLR